jgi:hypothetical protein
VSGFAQNGLREILREIMETHTSPDGALTFVVGRSDDGDVRLGFVGFPWHTHADVLAGAYGLPEEAAVAKFVAALLKNEAVIAISRKGDEPVDAWITDDPAGERRYTSEGETLELRYWSGRPWVGP